MAKQKENNSNNSKQGKSKYQQKVQARRRAAKRLDLPANTPWPVIWAAEDEEELTHTGK